MLDNKYNLHDQIGSGGFGRVYVATDELAKRKVAIKILHSEEKDDQLELISEIQYLASLQHFSIVTFFHHFFHEDRLCLVMEYCSNGSLFDKIENEGKQTIDYALEIGIQIAEVMKYVHSNGIVHHDIKSQNILFDGNGKLKVGDFGIANTLSGTTTHLAPEVFLNGNISATDPRIDVYALGLTILEMIIGENPFRDLEKNRILAKKMDQSFIPNYLPDWLQEIIIKATHPNPDLRFQDMSEFKLSLKSKSAPLTININKIKINNIVVEASQNLKKKKWGKTISYIERALELDSNSVLALITAGRYYLKIHHIEKAREHFEKALLINPSSDVRKELAEIKLSQNNYAQALSLLQNHIQLSPTDWEAYNLIGECYYRLSRFETTLDIIESVLKVTNSVFFWNNWLITRYCLGENETREFWKGTRNLSGKYFIEFNRFIKLDETIAWNNNQQQADKYLYQSYRFNQLKNGNVLTIRTSKGKTEQINEPIVSIGRNIENVISFENNTISRRHCAIINYPNDVWIYDLGSTLGTFVDGEKIYRKKFLLGKHVITIGNESFELFSSNEVFI